MTGRPDLGKKTIREQELEGKHKGRVRVSGLGKRRRNNRRTPREKMEKDKKKNCYCTDGNKASSKPGEGCKVLPLGLGCS